MQKLLGHARRGIQEYNMIAPGARVAVGLSGGKDSVALLCSLARLRTVIEGGFSLVAIAIDPRFGGAENDYSPIEALCGELGVPFFVELTDIGAIVFDIRQEKNPCSLCAKLRRGALCRKAADLGCDTLALGHHLDDALETFVMNLKNGSLACFSPVTRLEDTGVTVIRPFLFAPERDIERAVRKNDLPVVKNPCPVDGETRRRDIKQFLLEQEKLDPGLKARLLTAIRTSHLSGW